ncbi:hypothetical protein B0T26DRAFT_773296 [Lasiosphaeria miniovina]|uniref:Uncharacterized protein n=1 Tax=Lasiosphaeria miniovina TaxID=1954250 RepID=A0AA40AWV4_9PEZI|nr:uncharacterized protein B0T26DRAFT_773296 [Lasiosphaeria miniovina]KAK0723447.1 hypothetical protein B0T26DRAFT_773296 [Lasiosphaeria miniovina]
MGRKFNHPPTQDKNFAHIRHQRSGSGRSDSPRSNMQPRSYRDRHEPPSPTPTQRMAKSAATIGKGASTTQPSTGQNATSKQASGTASVDNTSLMPPTDNSAPPKLTAGFDVSAPDSGILTARPAPAAPAAAVPAVPQPPHLDKLTAKAVRLFSHKCQKCGLATCKNVALGSSVPCVEKDMPYFELVSLLPERIATMCLDEIVQKYPGAEQIYTRAATALVQTRVRCPVLFHGSGKVFARDMHIGRTDMNDDEFRDAVDEFVATKRSGARHTREQKDRFKHFREVCAWDPTSSEFKSFPTRIHSREELASLPPSLRPNSNARYEKKMKEDARYENLRKEKDEKAMKKAKEMAEKEKIKAQKLGHTGSLVINYHYSQQGPFGKGEEAEDNGKRWNCCGRSEFEKCGL